MQQLFDNYRQENIDMPYTLQDFQKDYIRDHLNLLSPDDRLKGLPSDEVLKHYSPDDRLRGLSPTDIINHLSPAEIKKLLEALGSAANGTRSQ
ncbi:MAG: hypothetical protein EPN21_08140 [Methylococcaceae bacterium]|nr:MAG: hypothetical protein EPN21_08140 [Methylococcaceae bacterium]